MEVALVVPESLKSGFQAGIGMAIEQACVRSGATLQVVSMLEHCIHILAENPKFLCLLNVEQYCRLCSLSQTVRSQLIVLRTSSVDLGEKRDSVDVAGVRYVLSADTPWFVEKCVEAILHVASGKKLPDMSRVLASGDGASRTAYVLKSSLERKEVQEGVGAFLACEVELRKGLVSRGARRYPKILSDVLDELLMNAIWDANPERASIDRSLAVVLDGNEAVAVDSFCNHSVLGISVVDSFGRFPLSCLVGPLKQAMGFPWALRMNEGPGGAGIGLYMIMRRANGIVVEVRANEITRVTVFLRTDLPFREMVGKHQTVLFLDDSRS